MQHSPSLAEGGLLATFQQVVMFVHEPVCGARKVLVFAKSLLSFAWSAAEVTCLARCFCTVIPHRGLSSCTYDACAPCKWVHLAPILFESGLPAAWYGCAVALCAQSQLPGCILVCGGGWQLKAGRVLGCHFVDLHQQIQARASSAGSLCWGLTMWHLSTQYKALGACLSDDGVVCVGLKPWFETKRVVAGSPC